MKIVSLHTLSTEGVSHNPEIQKQVMLRQGDVPHLTNFSRSFLAPGQTASAHAHADMWEVFLVSAGEGVIVLDGTSYPLAEGTCVLVEPGEVHAITNTGDQTLVLTYFGVA